MSSGADLGLPPSVLPYFTNLAISLLLLITSPAYKLLHVLDHAVSICPRVRRATPLPLWPTYVTGKLRHVHITGVRDREPEKSKGAACCAPSLLNPQAQPRPEDAVGPDRDTQPRFGSHGTVVSHTPGPLR